MTLQACPPQGLCSLPLCLSTCPPQLLESLQAGDYPLPLSRPAAAYEEALQLVKEGKVPCRTLR